ncbi:hypothetical protein OAT04_05210 [Candidatus Pelagibacter sp.]|jgi:hypothetical protein|nr:hypothetical protein [Candidatus Pelagibacter sp.]
MNLNHKQINSLKYLEQIFLLLNQANIRFFLEAGTLLKFFRYKKIFPSSDIDLGFYYKDRVKILNFLKKLPRKGYKVVLQNNFPIFEDHAKIYFPNSYKGYSTHIDFYIYKKNSKYLYLPRIHKPDKKSFFSTYLYYLINKIQKKNITLKSAMITIIIDNLVHLYMKKGKKDYFRFKNIYLNYLTKKKVSFLNFSLDINTPLMTKAYLRRRYGAQWMLPPKIDWQKKLNLK